MSNEPIDIDWDKNPPKSQWEVSRRSIAWAIQQAEIALGKLKSQIAVEPPDFKETLKLIESANEARRRAEDIDQQLVHHLEHLKGNS